MYYSAYNIFCDVYGCLLDNIKQYNLLFQINILQHATLSIDTNGPTELLVLRFAVTNSIIDPWIYILLRRETLESSQKIYRRIKKKLGYDASESSSREKSSSTTKEKQNIVCQAKVTGVTRTALCRVESSTDSSFIV